MTVMDFHEESSSSDPTLLSFNTPLRVVSGVQARTVSLDDPATLPRRRNVSEGQYQNGPDDGPSPDVPVRSPIRCVSPEFVNAIAMNPGGRPKEVESTHFGTCSALHVDLGFSCHFSAFQRHMHSYREAFEEMDGGPVSPTPTVGGEVFPQTPAFPISPQTPYFNLCKFPIRLTEGTVELRCSNISNIKMIMLILVVSLL